MRRIGLKFNVDIAQLLVTPNKSRCTKDERILMSEVLDRLLLEVQSQFLKSLGSVLG